MADPVIPDGKKVEVPGGSYTVRLLSVESIFHLAKVIGLIIDQAPEGAIDALDNTDVALIMMARSLPDAEEHFYAVLAQVCDMITPASPTKVPTDAEKDEGAAKARLIPAQHLKQILAALFEQEDLKDLFFELRGQISQVKETLNDESADSPA